MDYAGFESNILKMENHFQDECSSSEGFLRWMVVVGVLPLDSYTHEYKGDNFGITILK